MKDILICNRKIYTGLWSLSSEELKTPFIQLFSGDTVSAEEFHKLYFQWYNLIHEFTHILRDHYKISFDWATKGASEEQSANDFAISYWKHLGANKNLEILISNIERILDNIPSPVPNGIDFLDYCNKHFSELQTVEAYTFLQFTSVKNSFYSTKSFEEVLKDFGFKNLPKLEALNLKPQYDPQSIIDNCRYLLGKLNIETPKVEVIICDNLFIQRAE
ncbi:ImmA/IrrE family metallo-endopeptidase [Clostridium manihotivorum]|uniref:Uncharacterized protein n=1 Tax=Clostridium manihotivorum TaxID=2320868 RepID=A0A3R5UI50_9CLOT|nr:hypothetical protein [Clostridium manihotivorum]QAA34342.1 hypothetical protein C1I91_23365 [Clostridium manihotivorum]